MISNESAAASASYSGPTVAAPYGAAVLAGDYDVDAMFGLGGPSASSAAPTDAGQFPSNTYTNTYSGSYLDPNDMTDEQWSAFLDTFDGLTQSSAPFAVFDPVPDFAPPPIMPPPPPLQLAALPTRSPSPDQVVATAHEVPVSVPSVVPPDS
jgi:hypothetical protein